MNAACMVERREARTRIRSNVRASWPTSSAPVSRIGSSNWPAAIRSAAVSSRRSRRAKSQAPM